MFRVSSVSVSCSIGVAENGISGRDISDFRGFRVQGGSTEWHRGAALPIPNSSLYNYDYNNNEDIDGDESDGINSSSYNYDDNNYDDEDITQDDDLGSSEKKTKTKKEP